MIRSDDALPYNNWRRSCWVVASWKQAAQNHITYPPLQGNGWTLVSNTLRIEWDSDDNISITNVSSTIQKGMLTT